MLVAGILFYTLSLLMIISASLVIIVKNPVHSVLWLILCFFTSAGIFLLLGAEFISMMMIIVYVGAVAVLFIFVVMMLNVKTVTVKNAFNRYLPICLITAFVLIIDLYIVFTKSVNTKNVALVTPKIPIVNYDKLTNTKQIGLVLYTEYFYPFQIAAVILLVAMIGAIILTHRIRTGVAKQNIFKQITRKPSDCIEVLKVESGKGI